MTAAGPDPIDLTGLHDTVDPLVRQAGEIALQGFRTGILAEDKAGGRGDFDPVTRADRETEAFLRRELTARFPDAQVIGEEGGTTGPISSMTWIIDPIDGTKAYVTGVPMWGVLLGLVVDGRPVAGWCRQPYLDETFTAVDGQGWLELGTGRHRLSTSSTTDLALASMYSTHPAMFASGWERDAFEALAGEVRLQRFGGDCYSYCLLAAGHIDLVVEADMRAYDILPLVPIVEAGGGVVTGPDGEVPLEGGFIVAAATRALHAEAMTHVAAARPSDSRR